MDYEPVLASWCHQPVINPRLTSPVIRQAFVINFKPCVFCMATLRFKLLLSCACQAYLSGVSKADDKNKNGETLEKKDG